VRGRSGHVRRTSAAAALVLTNWLVVFSSTAAAPVPVTLPVVSYDIASTPRPGWGCWTHTFDGTVTDTGRTVSGSIVCPEGAFVPAQVLDYASGSGTLNDGNLDAAHLLVLRADDAGTTINPQVTVHFAEPVNVDTITIHGGDSVFAGGVERVRVTADNTAETFAASAVGEIGPGGVPRDDLIELAGTPLGGVTTNAITLDLFETSFFGSPFDQLVISEITVTGHQPEPPTHLLRIDIRPANKTNVINVRSPIPVPVLVASSLDLPVTAIDRASLRFGSLGTEPSVLGCIITPDVTGDRRNDLLCAVDPRRTGLKRFDTAATLSGFTKTGEAISGTDTVTVRP
jgi:hypothetical protein